MLNRNFISWILVAFGCTFFLWAAIIKVTFGSENSPLYKFIGIPNGYIGVLGIFVLLVGLVVNQQFGKSIGTAFVAFTPRSSEFLFRENCQNISLVYTFNILTFVITSSLYFNEMANSRLFLSVDGDHQLAVNEQTRDWANSWLYFGGNFLQGLGGNIGFPLNTKVDPGFIVGNFFGEFSISAAHTTWALLLFFSSLMLCRAMKLNTFSSILASWVSSIFIIFPGFWMFSTVPALIPWIAVTHFICSSFLFVLVGNFKNTIIVQIGRLFTLLILLFWILLHYSPYILLIAPICIIFYLVALLSIKDTKILVRECGISIIFFFITVFSGMLFFIYGTIGYTAASVFADQVATSTRTITSLSIIAEFGFPSAIVIFTVISVLLTIRQKRYVPQQYQIFMRGLLICFFTIITVGSIYIYDPQIWDGPAPNYFEFMLWPIYGIAFTVLVLRVAAELSVSIPFFSYRKKYNYKKLVSFYGMPLIIATCLIVYSQDYQTSREWRFPPPQDKIMRSLHNLQHQPGDYFKGRVATFTGLHIEGYVQWEQLQKYDYKVLGTFENDYRKAGLWYNSIPTLAEYTSLITPRSYAFINHFFSRPKDGQQRAMMTMRNIDLRILKPLGVNRIIADKPLDSLVELAREQEGNIDIYLYELQNSNNGDWSPTKIIVKKDLDSILNAISDPNLDLRTTVVLEDKPTALSIIPVKSAEIKVLKEGYYITAYSEKTSILLLPIEYSNCFNIKNLDSTKNMSHFVPANLIQSALIFSGRVKVVLEYKNGPLTNSHCRIDDLRSFRKLMWQSKH